MIAALLLAAAVSPAPAARSAVLSPYEQQTVDAILGATGERLEESPEGKRVESIEVSTLEVIEPRDPLPAPLRSAANWLHTTSRRERIASEVLLVPGERYDAALAEQSARNLRALPQLSLVLLLPLQGSAPGTVRIRVITKDVWSLRLNSSYLIQNGRLLRLLLQPSEENLAGTHNSAIGSFLLDPATFALGLQVVSPRVAGSRVNASASANVIFNRHRGGAEGSNGGVAVGQPLYSTRAEWAFGASASWDVETRRRFIGGETSAFDAASGRCLVSAAPGAGPACEYRRGVGSGSAWLIRSFGAERKQDVKLGFSALRSRFDTFDLSGLAPADQDAFRAVNLPRSDTQSGPSLEYHAYSSRYLDLLDLDTLGLTENVQRGHDLVLRLRPVTTALGSSRNFLEAFFALAWTFPLGDGLVRASVQGAAELARDVPDAFLDTSVRLATPRVAAGRLVFDARLLDHHRNYLNVKTTLGGDGRLRGYPAQLFSGDNLAVANLEARSTGLALSSVQVGGVLFADAGDAFDRFSSFKPKTSAGAGLRLVFPQLQRYVLRLDVGVPLSGGGGRLDVVATFGQAIPAVGN